MAVEGVLRRAGDGGQCLPDLGVAPRARQNGRYDLHGGTGVGDGEHIVRIREVRKGRLYGKHLLLRNVETLHIGAVDLHLTAQNGVHVGGKDPHQLRVPRLHHAQREHAGVVEQVEIVL